MFGFPRRPRLFLTAALALALVAGACASPEIPVVVGPTPEPSPTEAPAPTTEVETTEGPTPTPLPPAASEPGLTDEVIRIGVLADAGADGVTGDLGASSFEAVEAWAAAVNVEGGLAGRTVEVVRLDTRVFEHAAAVEAACSGDVFALVGSSALFDDQGLDRLLEPSCRLPDFPARVSSQARLDSPVTFASNPITGATWNAGWARYWSGAEPDAIARAATALPDLEPLVVRGQQMIEAASEFGYTFQYAPVVPFDADYTEVAAEIAELDIGAVHWSADGDRFLQLVNALAEAGVDPAILDCGWSCYAQSWVERAGRDGVGVTTWLPTLPFEETTQSPEVTRYLFWLGSVSPGAQPTAVGLASWAAASLFGEAVRQTVQQDSPRFDPGALTRDGVIASASQITGWTANGLYLAPSNPAEGQPSPCFVVMSLSLTGTWRRVHPRTPGTMDCDPSNLVRLQRTSDLENVIEATPTPDLDDLPPPTPEG